MSLLIMVMAIHFVLGGIGIAVINRKQDAGKRKMNNVKFLVYLITFIIVLIAILVNKNAFAAVSIIIFSVSLFEILIIGKPNQASSQNQILFTSLAIFTILAFCFSIFVLLSSSIISVTYATVVVFDGASQISGQIAGKRKVLPVLSPNKTWEGLIGGTVSAVITSVILHEYAGFSMLYSFFFGLLVCFSSFLGDMGASAFKRAFNVKDFGNLLPGQGGMLDRFDSFLATGAAVGILGCLTFLSFDQIDWDIAAYLGCSIILAGILLCGELIYFLFNMKAEYSRIFTHILAGILCMFLINIFTSEWYVIFICLQSAIFVFMTKKTGIFWSHHKVSRNTNGSSLFFIGILLAYILSIVRNDISLYILPVLILTLSDPVASLSGLNRNSGFLPGVSGSVSVKTYAGSLGFFFSAFIILLCGLSFFYDFSTFRILIFSLLISFVATITEAVSSNGTDNIFIPLSVALSLLAVAG